MGLKFRSGLMFLAGLLTAANFSSGLEAQVSENKQYVNEYCVVATDDSSVNDPDIALSLFSGYRWSRGPYHNFGEKPLIPARQFRIGYLPDGLLEKDYNHELDAKLRDVCGPTYRVAVIFTGPRFNRQAGEALRFVPSFTSNRNRPEEITYLTKAGFLIRVSTKSEIRALVYIKEGIDGVY